MVDHTTKGMLTTAITLFFTTALLTDAPPAFASRSSSGGDESVAISVKNGTEDELQTKAQLERLLEAYDLAPFIHTHAVQVVASVIPHSHPVLTVNTQYLDRDLQLLTTFVHEQLHWFANERDAQVEAAINEFRKQFTDVPVRGGEGARDVYSTYLHLIVCDLELQAMTALVGKDAARQTLAEAKHYQWIYRQVLENPVVREVNTRHGLIVP